MVDGSGMYKGDARIFPRKAVHRAMRFQWRMDRYVLTNDYKIRPEHNEIWRMVVIELL
jgi:hypothetical protein